MEGTERGGERYQCKFACLLFINSFVLTLSLSLSLLLDFYAAARACALQQQQQLLQYACVCVCVGVIFGSASLFVELVKGNNYFICCCCPTVPAMHTLHSQREVENGSQAFFGFFISQYLCVRVSALPNTYKLNSNKQ